MTRRVAYVVGVVSIVALAIYVAVQDDLLTALSRVSLLELAAMFAVSLLAAYLQGHQFRTVTEMFDLTLRRSEWLGLTAANTMINYLVPARAGLVVRATYLQRVHSMGLPTYAALTAMLMLMSIAVASLVGLAAYLGDRGSAGPGATALALIFLATAALSFGLAWLGARIASVGKRWKRLQKHATAFRDGVLVWRSNPVLAGRFALVSAAWIAAQACRLWLAFRAVGLDPSVAEIGMIQALVGVAFVVSITPGNLGIKEGAIAFATAAVGIDPALGLLAALVDRAVAFAVALVLGTTLGRPLLRLVRNQE